VLLASAAQLALAQKAEPSSFEHDANAAATRTAAPAAASP
jgi:hypothetical protein